MESRAMKKANPNVTMPTAIIFVEYLLSNYSERFYSFFMGLPIYMTVIPRVSQQAQHYTTLVPSAIIASMNIKKLGFIAIGVFLIIAALAIGISARFSLSSIAGAPYTFIENFFRQWSPALAAAGTIILALSIFFFIYESRRREEREQQQAIHALHDEIHWNLHPVITLRFGISEMARYIEEHHMTPSAPPPFELLDTRVFDDMRSRGQLHLLEDIRMDVVFCYILIRKYNMDREYKPNHLELLTELHKQLHKAIRDLEAKFEFLPRYVKQKDKSTQWEAES